MNNKTVEFYEPTASDLVALVAYRDDGECQVTLGFDAGQRVYQYHDFPRHLFELWKTATSAGRFYNTFVKGHDGDEVTWSDVWEPDSLSGSASPGN
jgi:hypothetical protein